MGDVSTPWTAFSFAGYNGTSSSVEFADTVRNRLFPALSEGVSIFINEGRKQEEDEEGKWPPSIQRICREYGHTEEDATTWLKSVK
jgi:hypothetical protein